MMMKHKRIAALLLALTAAFCLTGAANAADESPVVWEGTLTEVLEDGFVMQEADGREILFNVDEQTALDGFETLEDLDVGMYVIVESDGRLTKSIPPQAHADRVTCYWLAGQVESVDEEENTFLMQTELGEVIVHQGDLTTPVYAGMTVTVYFDGVMAMSLPGQIAARKIVAPELQGTVLEAPDLRGGAALVIAALQAEGCSAVHQCRHIQRGYADLAGDLAGLGARVRQNTE